MRKAQIIGQVFLFILAGLVFVLILGYGYRAIVGLQERGKEVQLLDFRNELESTIALIKRDYGSVRKVELRVPAGTETVCFANAKAGENENWPEQFKSEYPLLYSSWSVGSENVFLIPKQPISVFAPDIFIAEGYACFPAVNNKVRLRVEGLGDKAGITKWS